MADKLSHESRERKSERKGGAAFSWLGRGGSRMIPKGIDWSSPASAFRSAWTIIAYAPQGTLLRVAIGGAIGIHGIMLGASLMGRSDGGAASGEVAFRSRVNARDDAGILLGGRKPMDALITGYRTLLGDGPSRMDKNSDSLPDENSGEASENGAQPDSAGDELIGGGGADSAEDAIAAAKDAAAGLASGGRAKLGAITTNFGAGGSTSASLKAGSPENSRAASGPAGGSSGRAKDQIRQGGRRSTARPANARGSMNQLKFASAQSRRGLGAQNRAGAFQAATDAFEGQTAPGESGTPIGGSGAGMDGGSIGAAPNTGSAGPVNQKDVTNKTCPAGTFMTQGECQYIPPQNVTPWQNIVQKALGYFIAAAVLVTLGLTLLLKAPPGPWQILGGVLIAAGVSVGILGFVLGNQIEDEYGQSLQRDAIFDEGGRAIRGETPNTTGRSNLKGVENLYQKHDFGFNK